MIVLGMLSNLDDFPFVDPKALLSKGAAFQILTNKESAHTGALYIMTLFMFLTRSEQTPIPLALIISKVIPTRFTNCTTITASANMSSVFHDANLSFLLKVVLARLSYPS